MLGDVGVIARRNNKGGARRHGTVRLIVGQHGAGAQQHVGQLFMNFADALLGAGGAEGHFRGGQAAVHQGLAQRDGLVHIVESDDGDNADLVHTLQNRIHSTFSFFSFGAVP